MKDEMQMFSVRCERSTVRKLTIIAKEDKRKLAAVIRIALSEWVDRRIKEAKESAA